MPKYLYKFQPVSINSISNLANNYLYYCDPDKFNDPLDCIANFSTNIPKENITEYLTALNAINPKEMLIDFDNIDKYFDDKGNMISELHYRITNSLFQFRNYIRNIGVCCFCEKYTHPQMWAHYADGFRGFCIEFNLEKQENFHSIFKAVEYQESREFIKPQTIIDGITLEELRRKFNFLKNTYWSYEAEWRITSNPDTVDNYNPYSIRRIIFGHKINRDYMRAIVAVLSKYDHIKYAQAKPSTKNYRVYFSPYAI